MDFQNFQNEFLLSLPSEKWWAGLSLYQFNGIWFLPRQILGIQKVLSYFKALPTDVILAGHPKTGTTWLKSLLFSIMYRSSKRYLKMKNSHDLIPNLELQHYNPFAVIHDYASINGSCPSLTGSRIFNTHLPYEIIGETLSSSACKIVYVTREPKDTLISGWHFRNKFKGCEGQPIPIEIAVDQFCKGFVPYGLYYDHVLGYRKESLERPQNVFFITYEKLKADPKTHVKRLAGFLGCPFEGGENGEEELENTVRNCSFETLSNLEVNKSSDLLTDNPKQYNSFFRKGEVGDHMNFLKPDMILRIDEITKEKYVASGFNYGI